MNLMYPPPNSFNGYVHAWPLPDPAHYPLPHLVILKPVSIISFRMWTFQYMSLKGKDSFLKHNYRYYYHFWKND